ncbi:MAG: DUF2092 domain-containing protein, partial [Rhizobiales bacterium]|nr:DUF2092 domain-containing protein [Hyphomicrobiales bacterium]
MAVLYAGLLFVSEALYGILTLVTGSTRVAWVSFSRNLDVVTAEGLKIGLASSGTIALERPNKLRVTRHGGFADVDLVFDGEPAALYG